LLSGRSDNGFISTEAEPHRERSLNAVMADLAELHRKSNRRTFDSDSEVPHKARSMDSFISTDAEPHRERSLNAVMADLAELHRKSNRRTFDSDSEVAARSLDAFI
jgi:uncharacterized protein (DUF4213/DUF364 family)